VPAAYDPDPDYFFHWLRDSALVVDALLVLLGDPAWAAAAREHIRDFVGFSLALNALDGAAATAVLDPAKVAPDMRRHLRPATELAAIRGEEVGGEVRVNPDGTLDVLQWGRPQFDGPALRALTLLRLKRLYPEAWADCSDAAPRLLADDLDFVAAHWDRPGFDLWEERLGRHYYTLAVQRAALRDGADDAEAAGDPERAAVWRRIADDARAALDAMWSDEDGRYRRGDGAPEPDIAIVLAAIHARRVDGRHGVLDDRLHATLVQLEDLFAEVYAINRGRAGAPALGRYRGDVYYSGGAYYFSTLAAAELQYRMAGAVAAGHRMPVTATNRGFLERIVGTIPSVQGSEWTTRLHAALCARGDAYLETVRRFTPADGMLAEQFDQNTGAPNSARHLAWSYAAFISAVAARRAASVMPR
jgi:glucoamylase